MIRAHFGLAKNPFEQQPHTLLAHQQEVHDILLVHCQQGGLCIVAGEPGTGKSVVKNHLQEHDKKRLITPTIGRTLHTYFTLLRILCQAFEIDYDGGDFKCEKRLIEQARSYQRQGKSIADSSTPNNRHPPPVQQPRHPLAHHLLSDPQTPIPRRYPSLHPESVRPMRAPTQHPHRRSPRAYRPLKPRPAAASQTPHTGDADRNGAHARTHGHVSARQPRAKATSLAATRSPRKTHKYVT